MLTVQTGPVVLIVSGFLTMLTEIGAGLTLIDFPNLIALDRRWHRGLMARDR